MRLLSKKYLGMLLVAGALTLGSCSAPKDVVYFQDITNGQRIDLPTVQAIKLKPGDELSIVISSKDPELSAMFNLNVYSVTPGKKSEQVYTQYVGSYTVDPEGNIEFPVLGTLHVEGLTRDQLEKKIKQDLVDRSLLTNPIVTVKVVNAFYSVSGEVLKPGRYEMNRDRMTILDALSTAGDMTIFGNRKEVVVIRNEHGQQTTYVVDLTDGESLSKSPAYILEQEDVVYVAPNNARIRQSTVNGNNLISYSFWVSILSVATSIAVLIVQMVK